MIYAYGICEATAAMPPPQGRGLGGAKLRTLQSGAIAAIYSRHRSLRARPEANQVLTHERVLEQIMARGPVVPLRFGTQLQREEQLAVVLARRGTELLQTIDRVRGRVELGIRVIPEWIKETNRDGAAVGGREMLIARVGEHRRALRVARELHAPLAAIAAASTMQEYPRPPAILVASYLVDADRVAAFRRQAKQLAASQNKMRVLITGPWPPYSFAAAEQR
jgi:hypothetical protein